MLTGLLCLPITALLYLASKALYQKFNFVLLSPLIVVPGVLIFLLNINHLSYTRYLSGGQWLTKLLGPATVAMAVPLYRNLQLLKRYASEIIISICAGSTLAIVSSMLLSAWLRFNPQAIISIAPRSVTTPIAIDISKVIGGVQPLTAVFVILTGLIGLVIGPLLIKLLPIRSSVAKGVMLGVGAHGCGISKALELGMEEGTIASLAMIVTAGVTLVLAPFIVPMVERVLL